MGRSWLAQLSLALTAAAAVLLIALAQPPNGRTELPQVNGVSYPDYMPWSASLLLLYSRYRSQKVLEP